MSQEYSRSLRVKTVRSLEDQESELINKEGMRRLSWKEKLEAGCKQITPFDYHTVIQNVILRRRRQSPREQNFDFRGNGPRWVSRVSE